jgi:hypothetical protein
LGLTQGTHALAFKQLSGWNTPASTNTTISVNQKTTTTGTYTVKVVQLSGLLQVTLSPPGAVSAGAQWQVDGGAWQISGAADSILTVGTHALAFKQLSGWNTPERQNVTISANQRTTATGIYVLSAAGYNYTNNNGTITITKYTGPGGDVIIPDTITGLPVTTIGGYYDGSLGYWMGAFMFCTNVTNVTIPGSITNIGDRAFWGCSLSSVTISTNVTSIGEDAFYGCSRLNNLTIPNSVTSIEGAAFYDCTSLTNVTMGNSLTSIGDDAFSGCTSLTSVTIPNSVTNIGSSPFCDCTTLKAITVDAANSLYSSVQGVLFDKSQSTLLEYPGGVAGGYAIPIGVISIGSSAFLSCSSLTSITIPNTVVSIGAGAFVYCTGLATVTIGNGVRSVGALAFQGCGKISYLMIPDSVTNIGVGAFSYSHLNGVYFKGNAPSAASNVFYNNPDNPIVYYLPGTTGWSATFGGRATALWFLPNPSVLSSPGFGIQPSRFGFIISWATNIPVLVEGCTNLSDPTWSPVHTNTLINGSAYFGDPEWTNYPGRFYRLRSL